jgi:ABC-type transport system involved in cytochrome bd biosynthesis fused ATPase/permease subunit
LQLTILKIILWPKNTDLRPRVIQFEPGKINVISGDNGTGKSTLTWIVDYCLGSEKCSIPVGLIRELTGWFGLHLKLANRAPKSRRSTIHDRLVLERRTQTRSACHRVEERARR